ncbi:hypothetical protein JRQ81_014540, partial [Phrynocephalus forsythii]
ESVRENGLQSCFTLSLVEGLANNNDLLPADWKALIKEMVSPSQYAAFLQEFHDLAVIQAIANLNNNNNQITWDMLCGEGQFAAFNLQVAMPQAALQQMSEIVKQAWTKMPKLRTPLGHFGAILQEKPESGRGGQPRHKLAPRIAKANRNYPRNQE